MTLWKIFAVDTQFKQSYATSRNKSRQKVCLALYITSVSVRQCQWHQSCNLFMITIENLLHFLEYFDDIVNSMKDFPLGFVKVQSTHLSFVFLNKCRKIWKRKDHGNILCSAILNLATWPTSLVPGLLVHENVTGIVQIDRVWSCSSKTAEENKENIIKLDVSLIRQNIKWFASTPVTDFRADRARTDISAEFFQKIIFHQEGYWIVFFFLKTGFKIGVRIIHGCTLYTGKYGNFEYIYTVTIPKKIKTEILIQAKKVQHQLKKKASLYL